MKQLIKRWLNEQKSVIAFIIVIEILLLIFREMFEASANVIGYFQLIFTCVSIIFILIKGYFYYRYYQQLKIELMVIGESIEELYRQKINHLQEKIQQLNDDRLVFQQNQRDYYTLWAHQIKTPIAAAKLLLMQDPIQPQWIEYELFKIQQYVDFVLHYLRVESFHEDLVLQEINLDKVIRQTIKKYAPFFIQKKIVVEYHGTNQKIKSDEKWLAVILEQLLSNAIKYTNVGMVKIEVWDQKIYIKDTGIGIQASDIERVFDRGFTGYNGRINQQSSGLGLYLCRLIGEQLGLTLKIESIVKQGTTVIIEWSKETALIYD